MRPPPKPLPLAPRPLPGETVLSWVGRVAARYDLSAPQLLTQMNGGRPHPSSPLLAELAAGLELDRCLASVARVDVDRIEFMRVVQHHSVEARRWSRPFQAWCQACLQDDVARRGEVHERMAWRLGFCVICLLHDGLLAQACAACGRHTCAYHPVDGRLRLVCGSCRTAVDTWPSERPDPLGLVDDPSPLGLSLSAELTRLVAALQTDLLAEMGGAAQTGPWAPGCSAIHLPRTARELGTVLLNAAYSGAWRPPEGRGREAAFERLHVRAAFDLFGLVAAALSEVFTGSLSGVDPHRFALGSGVIGPVKFAMLVRQLDDDKLEMLRSGMRGWEPAVARAAREMAEILTAARLRALEENRRWAEQERQLRRSDVAWANRAGRKFQGAFAQKMGTRARDTTGDGTAQGKGTGHRPRCCPAHSQEFGLAGLTMKCAPALPADARRDPHGVHGLVPLDAARATVRRLGHAREKRAAPAARANLREHGPVSTVEPSTSCLFEAGAPSSSGMFLVDEATTAAIRRAWDEDGEIAAVVELRRHFAAIMDGEDARRCVRAIVAAPAPGSAAPALATDVEMVLADLIRARDLPIRVMVLDVSAPA